MSHLEAERFARSAGTLLTCAEAAELVERVGVVVSGRGGDESNP